MSYLEDHELSSTLQKRRLKRALWVQANRINNMKTTSAALGHLARRFEGGVFQKTFARALFVATRVQNEGQTSRYRSTTQNGKGVWLYEASC